MSWESTEHKVGVGAGADIRGDSNGARAKPGTGADIRSFLVLNWSRIKDSTRSKVHILKRPRINMQFLALNPTK